MIKDNIVNSKEICDYQNNLLLYKYKCISNESALPCVGINAPMMTNGYNNSILSKNASDIESALFGIGATQI